MSAAPIIPVVVIEDLTHVASLARALVAGGLLVLEIALPTPVALDAVGVIAPPVAGAIVGVGTLTESLIYRRG